MLNLPSGKLVADFGTFGFLFEALATRDLRIYSECNGIKVFRYKDNVNLEIDVIIQLNDGRWGGTN